MNFIIAVKADSYRVEQKVLLFRILSTSLADIKLFSFLFFSFVVYMLILFRWEAHLFIQHDTFSVSFFLLEMLTSSDCHHV